MTEAVVRALCDLPADFHRRGDVTMVELLVASGYPEQADDITEADIERHLRGRPQLIDEWDGYSADQRCSDCWYLTIPIGRQPKSTPSVVGYLPAEGPSREVQRFADPFAACAFYITKVAESLLRHVR